MVDARGARGQREADCTVTRSALCENDLPKHRPFSLQSSLEATLRDALPASADFHVAASRGSASLQYIQFSCM